jgi:hypothetical protein
MIVVFIQKTQLERLQVCQTVASGAARTGNLVPPACGASRRLIIRRLIIV